MNSLNSSLFYALRFLAHSFLLSFSSLHLDCARLGGLLSFLSSGSEAERGSDWDRETGLALCARALGSFG